MPGRDAFILWENKDGLFYGKSNLVDFRQNTKLVWSCKSHKHELKHAEYIN